MDLGDLRDRSQPINLGMAPKTNSNKLKICNKMHCLGLEYYKQKLFLPSAIAFIAMPGCFKGALGMRANHANAWHIYKQARAVQALYRLQIKVVEDDVNISAVAVEESARNSAKLYKAYFFVNMHCRKVACNNSIKLH